MSSLTPEPDDEGARRMREFLAGFPSDPAEIMAAFGQMRIVEEAELGRPVRANLPGVFACIIRPTDRHRIFAITCPYALTGKEGRARVLDRYAADPGAGLPALLLEYTARALNPRQGLAGSQRVKGHGLAAALTLAGLLEADPRQRGLLRASARHLDEAPWRLFEVQRAYSQKGKGARRLRSLAAGDRAQMTAALRRAAGTRAEVSAPAGIERAWKLRRGPATEWLLAVAPAGPADKTGRGFSEQWEQAIARLRRAPVVSAQSTM